MAGTSRRAPWWGWAAITVVCVLYAPMAIEYTWHFFVPDSPQLWNSTFGGVVGDDHALGEGSIHGEQEQRYADNRVVLLAHTTAGGVAILLFAAQFSARLRRNLVRHRWLGRVALLMVAVGMVASSVFLLRVGPSGTFDGPAFYLQLWGLALATVVTATLGFWAIRARQVAVHQSMMAFAFAMLLTAPMLRVLYLLLGLAWPDMTQEVTNLAGGALLVFAAPGGAIAASRSFGSEQRRAGVGALPGRWLDVAVTLVAALALAVAVPRQLATFDGLDRVTLTWLLAGGAALATTLVLQRSARREGRGVAAEEWRLYALGVLSSVPAGLLLWLVYDVWFRTDEAFFGSLLTAPGLTLLLAFLVAVLRRRVVRPAGKRAAGAVLPTAEPVVAG